MRAVLQPNRSWPAIRRPKSQTWASCGTWFCSSSRTAPRRSRVKAIEDAFRALPAKVPEIVDFEWGTNNSPENRAQGFTHCFFVTFNDAAGRAVYLPHPAHKAFGKILRPHLDKVLVIDYVAKAVVVLLVSNANFQLLRSFPDLRAANKQIQGGWEDNAS